MICQQGQWPSQARNNPFGDHRTSCWGHWCPPSDTLFLRFPAALASGGASVLEGAGRGSSDSCHSTGFQIPRSPSLQPPGSLSFLRPGPASAKWPWKDTYASVTASKTQKGVLDLGDGHGRAQEARSRIKANYFVVCILSGPRLPRKSSPSVEDSEAGHVPLIVCDP